MALPVNGSRHLNPAYYSFIDPESRLTCSGRFTHNSGHPSAADRAQDRESSPVRDRRSTTVPCHQLRRITLAIYIHTYIHTYIHPFNGPFSGTTRVSRYQKCKTNLDFTEARDSEWQWHQLGHMQVCTSLQTDNHDSTPPLSFLQAGCPSCRPTNSVKALKASNL